MIPKFELQNAFVSALNDWEKEVLECENHIYFKKENSEEGIKKL